jgi:hypothetical protein
MGLEIKKSQFKRVPGRAKLLAAEIIHAGFCYDPRWDWEKTAAK